MEWLEQTRRVSKGVDIICMETIDSIIDVLPYVKRKLILDNKKFFNRFCVYYHKDNPIDLIKKVKPAINLNCKACNVISEYVESSIDRCWSGINMVQVAWWECVDFFWERPELVVPGMLDPYVQVKIAEVCKNHKKQNPLENGMWQHFGKHWKGTDGQWRDERRKRSLT